MKQLIPVFAAMIGGLVLLGILGQIVRGIVRKRAVNKENEPAADAIRLFAARKAVLSPAERSFLGVLEQVLPEDVGLLVKIRLGDVFVTRQGLAASDRAAAWNRINQKHVDFLLVRNTDLAPIAGIELDDSSHEEDSRKRRDEFVDGVFKSCNIPLLHVPAQAAYNPNELKAKIEACLSADATVFHGVRA
jgi:hypothetical protein